MATLNPLCRALFHCCSFSFYFIHYLPSGVFFFAPQHRSLALWCAAIKPSHMTGSGNICNFTHERLTERQRETDADGNKQDTWRSQMIHAKSKQIPTDAQIFTSLPRQNIHNLITVYIVRRKVYLSTANICSQRWKHDVCDSKIALFQPTTTSVRFLFATLELTLCKPWLKCLRGDDWNISKECLTIRESHFYRQQALIE